MKRTVTTCDRCGMEIRNSYVRLIIIAFKGDNSGRTDHRLEYCNTCANYVEDVIKKVIKPFETT